MIVRTRPISGYRSLAGKAKAKKAAKKAVSKKRPATKVKAKPKKKAVAAVEAVPAKKRTVAKKKASPAKKRTVRTVAKAPTKKATPKRKPSNYMLIDKKNGKIQTFSSKTTNKGVTLAGKRSRALKGAKEDATNLLIMAAGGLVGHFAIKKIAEIQAVKNAVGGSNAYTVLNAGAAAVGLAAPLLIKQLGANPAVKSALTGLAVVGASNALTNLALKATGSEQLALAGGRRPVRTALPRTTAGVVKPVGGVVRPIGSRPAPFRGVVAPVGGVVAPVGGISDSGRINLAKPIRGIANAGRINLARPVSGIADSGFRNSSNPLAGIGL